MPKNSVRPRDPLKMPKCRNYVKGHLSFKKVEFSEPERTMLEKEIFRPREVDQKWPHRGEANFISYGAESEIVVRSGRANVTTKKHKNEVNFSSKRDNSLAMRRKTGMIF